MNEKKQFLPYTRIPTPSGKIEPASNLDFPVEAYYVDVHQMYDNHVSFHWHEEFEFIVLEQGSALIKFSNETVTLSAGEGIAINQNAMHAIYPVTETTPCVFYSVIFHPAYLFGYGQTLASTKYLVPVLASPSQYISLLPSDKQTGVAIDHLLRIAELIGSNEYTKELLIKSELCQIWSIIITQFMPANSSLNNTNVAAALLDETRVKQALTFMQDNYMQPLTLDDIAASIPISRSECCRCFKRTLSLSPFEYLMKYRIYEAAKKIYRQDPIASSIADLAVSVGFNNTSYFNKLFKKYIHLTPLGYKKYLRKEPGAIMDAFGTSPSVTWQPSSVD